MRRYVIAATSIFLLRNTLWNNEKSNANVYSEQPTARPRLWSDTLHADCYCYTDVLIVDFSFCTRVLVGLFGGCAGDTARLFRYSLPPNRLPHLLVTAAQRPSNLTVLVIYHLKSKTSLLMVYFPLTICTPYWLITSLMHWPHSLMSGLYSPRTLEAGVLGTFRQRRQSVYVCTSLVLLLTTETSAFQSWGSTFICFWS
jgi:hypothetical protein